MLRKLKTVAVSLLSVGLAATAVAAPLSPAPSVDVAPSIADLVVPVHGCHRDVRRDTDTGGGLHYHTRVGNDPCKTVWAGRGRYREPPPPRYYEPPRRRQACYQDCNYIGPIKQCRTVCR